MAEPDDEFETPPSDLTELPDHPTCLRSADRS